SKRRSCNWRGSSVVGELLEDLTQHTGGSHPPTERQPQGRAVELQFEAFGIAADAAPFAFGSAQQSSGIESYRIDMTSIHMRDNLGLGRYQLGGITGFGQNLL